MASPGRDGALQTPRPEGQAGILRSPRTPGTGSSVRFGMRIYETGEESVLSASQGSSIYPVKDADASASMQLSDMSNLDEQHTSLQESMSMEMSFTESFLKREVGDALAGLAQSTSEPLLPTTPGAKPALPAPAPDTVRARPVPSTIQQEPTSPLSSSLPGDPTMHVSENKRSPSTSPLSSPTPRLAEVAEDEDSFEHEAPTSSPTFRPPAPTAQSLAEPVSVAAQSTSTPPVSPPPNLSRQSFSFATRTSTSPAHSPPPVSQPQIEEPLGAVEKQDDINVEPRTVPLPTVSPSTQQDTLRERETGLSTSPTTSPTMRAHPAAASSPPAQEQPRVAASAAQTPTSTSRSLSRIGTPGSRLSSLHHSRRTTPDRDASYMTSFASWATPRSDASGLHSPEAEGKTKHADGWPGVYEFSYLTEKDELDEEEAGELVPYALEELTNKLVSIDSLGNVDARELLETVAQLDRTHTERTIFLQHRLARSYRLNQVLRTNLHHAQERLAAFESHVTNLLDHQPTSDAPVAEELRRLAVQLEEQLQMLPSTPMLAIEPGRDDDARDTERASLEEARAELVREQEAHEAAQAHFNQARAQLDLERVQLQDERRRIEQEQSELRQAHLQHDMERRDLEIRLAAQPSAYAVSEEEVERRIAHAVAVARESALRDAEVRRAQAQPAAASEGDAALRAEIDRLHVELERRTQDADDVIASLQSEIETLHTKPAEPQSEAWEAHVAELERMLDEAEADAQAAQESFRNQELERLELQTQLEERVAELENQVHEGAEAVLCLSKAKQESEAELTATIHNQRKRIHALEHDVAHRGLELVKLEKQKENLTKEAMHFSLALSAKDQELQMLKRGTQNATAHWKTLAQRNAPNRRALQPKSTNGARRVSSEAAKRMIQQGSPSVGLASTPNPVRRDVDRRLPSVSSKGLPDLSTSTIASVELSYRP